MSTVTITAPARVQAPDDLPDLDAIQRKYTEAANKRIRPEGASQFVALSEAAEERLRFLSQDPWVNHDALNSQTPPVVNGATYKFVIVGAGFGGLQFAVRLIESGLATAGDIRFLDAAGGFGGTWYWNRYPGLHCDLESYIYMPLLEETGYIPTQKYAKGAEIREHAERIARHWKLTDSALFRAAIKELVWNDEKSVWKVVYTEKRDEITPLLQQDIQAQYVYLAGGGLVHPQVPRIPGLTSFKGQMFHTARWNYDVSGGSQDRQHLTGFEDKRVAVIGTAATAIGVIPEIGRYAKELFVVQRTPAYTKARNQQVTDPDVWKTKIAAKSGWQWERQLNWNSFITNSAKPGEEDMTKDGWTDMPAYSGLLGSPAHGVVDPSPESLARHTAYFHKLDLPHMTAVRSRIDEVVKDPVTADKLKPWYNSYCKRPTISDEYLQLFNKPHVHLVDTEGQGPATITYDGLIVNGEEFTVDIIVFCTGYSLSSYQGNSPGARLNINVLGRGGLSLDDKWRTGSAATLHGYATNGFPNLFFTGASQGTAAGNNVMMLRIIADNVTHILEKAIERAGAGQRPVIEVTKEAEEAHVAEVSKRSPFFSLIQGCTPGYFNGHGSARTVTDPETKARAARGSIWSEGTQSFMRYVQEWQKGDLSGIGVGIVEESQV